MISTVIPLSLSYYVPLFTDLARSRAFYPVFSESRLSIDLLLRSLVQVWSDIASNPPCFWRQPLSSLPHASPQSDSIALLHLRIFNPTAVGTPAPLFRLGVPLFPLERETGFRFSDHPGRGARQCNFPQRRVFRFSQATQASFVELGLANSYLNANPQNSFTSRCLG